MEHSLLSKNKDTIYQVVFQLIDNREKLSTSLLTTDEIKNLIKSHTPLHTPKKRTSHKIPLTADELKKRQQKYYETNKLKHPYIKVENPKKRGPKARSETSC